MEMVFINIEDQGYVEQREAKMFLKYVKRNVLAASINRLNIFSESQNCPCVTTKFPVFSLSGKSKNMIPCFLCDIDHLEIGYFGTPRVWVGLGGGVPGPMICT